MKKILLGLILILFLDSSAYSLTLESVDITSGYLNGKLNFQGSYEAVPIFFGFNFDAKPAASKIGVKPRGYLNFVVELFFSAVDSPGLNMEVGVNILLRYAHPITRKLYPYIKAGAGIAHGTQRVEEQSTAFNFCTQGELGVICFIQNKWSLNFGGRFRHLSHAGLFPRNPNGGINVFMGLVGLSYYFDKKVNKKINNPAHTSWGFIKINGFVAQITTK